MAIITCLVIAITGGIMISQMPTISTQRSPQQPTQSIPLQASQSIATVTPVPKRETPPTWTPIPQVPPTWTPVPATPTSRPPSQTDSGISGIASNYVTTQEQAGVEVELVRVLCIDGDLARDEVKLTDSQYDGMKSACEFILRVTNHSNKVINIFPQEGVVIINGEQINLSDYQSAIANLEEVNGTIYPNVTRVGGFWYAVRRSNWTEIDSMIYIIEGPTDDNSRSLGDKYHFEMNLSRWGFEPLPRELASTKPDTAPKTSSPPFTEQTQSLGPIWNTLRDEFFSVKLSITNVEWFREYDYLTPKAGYIYLVTHLTIENLGPGSIHDFGPYNFRVMDENKALRDEAFLNTGCRLDIVDLMPNGKISGCVSFEVPISGSIELIYAPYRYSSLEPGRYLSFVLRQ